MKNIEMKWELMNQNRERSVDPIMPFLIWLILYVAAALATFYSNGIIFLILLLAAPVVLPIVYVKLWKTPKIEALKAACVVLAIEGIPTLTFSGYLIVPLAIIYLANVKKTDGKKGIAITCLVFGILYVLGSFLMK